MCTSLKGGKFFFAILRFFMSVIQILHEFQSGFVPCFWPF